MRILLVEDEPGIANAVRRGLAKQGYDVHWCADGKAGLQAAVAGGYRLVILDLMLPEVDGWKICEELRTRRDPTPILMLSARGAVEDRVRGLDLGADDYLPKPFDLVELVARVRSLLRREAVHKTRIITVADLSIDTGRQRVTRAGEIIHLSPREYTLLEALAANEGRTLTREIVQDSVWMDPNSFSNVVDAYIRLLRRKVDTGHSTKLIHTVRGLGYTLEVRDIHDDQAAL